MRNLKQYLAAPFILMTAFMLVFYPDLAWAQASSAGGGGALESMGQITSYSVQVITAAAHFLIQYMPALWGTDLITGPQVIAGIKPMWMFIRNFVNLVMVLVLLFIVFANLVTAGGEIGGGKLKDWTIKEKLPKLIFTLVAVNFTIMGIKLLADAVYVGTVALFSIGDQAVIARGGESIEDMYSMMVDTKTFKVCEGGGGGGNCKPVRKIINDVYCPSGDAKKDPCLFKMRDSINVGQLLDPAKKNIMVAFGHYVMHLEMLPVVAAQKDFMSVLDNAIFSLVMAVAYVLAMIASFIVLLVRVIMIWVFILLSPILLASLVMGVASEDLGKILKIVMAYMVVPMKIAAAFAFSFVMVSVVETIQPSPTNFASTMEPGPPLVPFWGLDGWGWIWKILTVVLFWKSVFEFALADVPGMSGVIGKIKGFGETMAGNALTSIGNQAKIPGTSGADGNPVGAVTGAKAAFNIPNRQAQANQRKVNSFSDTLNGGKSGASDNKAMTAANKLKTTLRQTAKTNAQMINDGFSDSIKSLQEAGMDKSSFSRMTDEGAKSLDSPFKDKGYGDKFISKNRAAISRAWTDGAKEIKNSVTSGMSDGAKTFLSQMNSGGKSASDFNGKDASNFSNKDLKFMNDGMTKGWKIKRGTGNKVVIEEQGSSS